MKIRDCVLLALVGAPLFATPVILNPSFEDGAYPGGFTTVGGGDPGLLNWDVLGHSIDYIGSYWQASDGSRSVDLNGNGQGGVSQLVSGFTVGGQYKLSFDLSGNPDDLPIVKNVRLSITGQTDQLYSFDTTSHDKTNMGWEPHSFTFYATATDLAITFMSEDPAFWGAALDNISIQETPEPATYALMGVGLAALAFTRRRR